MRYRDVLEFWFGVDPVLAPSDIEQRRQLWYQGGAAVDDTIRERFGALVTDSIAGAYAEWENQARSRLALIIALDQFPRNIYRGTAQAFAGDSRALQLALDGIDQGMDRELVLVERMFYYLPLQHAEDLEVQDRSVIEYQTLTGQCEEGFEDFVQSSMEFTREHRDVVARFGRFPHRNKTLGRTSTDEEIAYLADGAPNYGQNS